MLMDSDFRATSLDVDAFVDDDVNARHTRNGVDKQTMCTFFQQGICIFGQDCQFRHERRLKQSLVCKHWLRSLCKKADDCEFFHIYDASLMPVCQFFEKYGECSKRG
jgi:cleavage and polyadenylation specificity factor subunit 4